VHYNESHTHDTHTVSHTVFNGLNNAVLMSCAIIVSNDRHHAVIQSKNRHKHKALQLKVNTEHRLGGTERCQDQIHSVGHQGTDSLYHDGRGSYLIDLSDQMSVGSESFHGNIQFLIEFQVKP